MIKISFIIPFYNVEKYIEECIRSLYNQDVPLDEYEVICVNDCSPDNSVEIIKKLQKEYSNILLIEHTENKRLGGARNTGLKYAKGEYIWFVDSDDLIKPDSLGILFNIMKDNQLDILQFGWDNYEEGQILELPKKSSTLILTGTELFFDNRFTWWKNHITAWSKVYRKSFLIENNIWFAENVMYEDNDYAIKVYSLAKRCMYISENLYLPRVNFSSITRDKYSSQHILYWISLNKRLVKMYVEFKKKCFDDRYIVLMRDFIKYNYNRSFELYEQLSDTEKVKAKVILEKMITISDIKYLSIRRYISFLYKNR